MKPIFPLLVGVLLMSSCSNTDSNKSSEPLVDIWFKYDEPVNGYDIKLHCRQAFDGYPNYFSLELYLNQGHRRIKKITTELIALERIWRDDFIGQDTIILHNTHEEIGSPFIDCKNIVYFEDMNFDGKKDLVICMFPGGAPNIGDCENYLVYSINDYGMTLCDNTFTREIGKAVCRADYTVDSLNKSITLTEYDTYIGYTEKKYWFKNGYPYKYDYTKVYDDEKFQYHIKLYDAELDVAENYWPY